MRERCGRAAAGPHWTSTESGENRGRSRHSTSADSGPSPYPVPPHISSCPDSFRAAPCPASGLPHGRMDARTESGHNGGGARARRAGGGPEPVLRRIRLRRNPVQTAAVRGARLLRKTAAGPGGRPDGHSGLYRHSFRPTTVGIASCFGAGPQPPHRQGGKSGLRRCKGESLRPYGAAVREVEPTVTRCRPRLRVRAGAHTASRSAASDCMRWSARRGSRSGLPATGRAAGSS